MQMGKRLTEKKFINSFICLIKQSRGRQLVRLDRRRVRPDNVSL